MVVAAAITQGGQAQTPAPLEFEVATVKAADPDARGGRFMMQPGGKLSINNMTLKNIIAIAYQVRDFQITGGPGWMTTDRFDIEARSGDQAPAPDMRSMKEDQREKFQKELNQRVRALLADRFKLVVREEEKEMPTYALVVAKNGPKLKASELKEGGNLGIRMGRGEMTGMTAQMKMLANVLGNIAGRPVTDKTGLDGTFDWTLKWTPDAITPNSPVPGSDKPNAPEPSDVSGPSIFTALQEQLGLRLEPQKAPALMIIVESAAKPSAN